MWHSFNRYSQEGQPREKGRQTERERERERERREWVAQLGYSNEVGRKLSVLN